MKKVYTLNRIESQGYCEEKYNEIIGRLKALTKQCRDFLEDEDGGLEYTVYWSPKKVKIENSLLYRSVDTDRHTLRIDFTSNDEIACIDGLDHYHKLLDFTIDNWEQIGLESQLKFDLENAKSVREKNNRKENKDMDMENYIVINGKKAELTEEQLEKLGIKPEKNKYEEMFQRGLHDDYYYTDAWGDVDHFSDEYDTGDEVYYNVGNYCKDEAVMRQRALHEILNRLLWRASVIAGEPDNEWGTATPHYYIYYNVSSSSFKVYHYYIGQVQGTTYFPTEESANDAIENIVKPFMKEHPEFVW